MAQTSLREIYRLGRPRMVAYLQQTFTTQTAQAQAGHALGAVRAALEGAVLGAGQGLPVSASGQSFAWPYLLQRTALLPDGDPHAWAIGLLAAGLGLALLLRRSWAGIWRGLQGGGQGAAAAEPEGLALLAAIVPCWLLQWRLAAWALRFEAAAAVGLLLILTGQFLRLGERWAADAPGEGARIPPWLALLAGLLAGFGTLPGLSALALLLAVARYARAPAEGAGRFALLATNGVLVLQGLVGLPGALLHFEPAYLLLAVGAAAGAAGGGWLLLALLRAFWERALPVLASYCTALGGLLLLFGVLTR